MGEKKRTNKHDTYQRDKKVKFLNIYTLSFYRIHVGIIQHLNIIKMLSVLKNLSVVIKINIYIVLCCFTHTNTHVAYP